MPMAVVMTRARPIVMAMPMANQRLVLVGYGLMMVAVMSIRPHTRHGFTVTTMKSSVS